MTLPEALKEIASHYRSHRQAAYASDIDRAYWNRLLWGQLTNPSDETLKKLGLKKVVTYEWDDHA